jgi:site-specific DNA-cytosine methylase
MLTFADLCCGGGGATMGAMAAGLTPIWAIEHDPAIAEVYRSNLGDHIIVGDVATQDIAALEPPDVLWGSFPCQAHSIARSKHMAERTDGDLSLCILDYARLLTPSVIVLENVPPWMRAPVYGEIVAGLSALGYFVDGRLVDASHHGVPQSRRRAILRATRGTLLPALPPRLPALGWYDAVADLLPDLPETSFAPWQLQRLVASGRSFVLDGGYSSADRGTDEDGLPLPRGATRREQEEPLFTVTATLTKRPMRAFLVEQSQVGRAATVREVAEPSATIQAWHGRRPGNAPRAYLVHNQISEGANAPVVREDDELAPAVTMQSGGRVRAMLMQMKHTRNEWGDGTRDEADPAFSVLTDGKPSHQPKAFLTHPTAMNPRFTIREEGEASHTLTCTTNPTRAWIGQGRVVALSPRCLARFQTFPDSYMLPKGNGLAGRIIGNAVPVRLAQRILVGLVADLVQGPEKEHTA